MSIIDPNFAPDGPQAGPSLKYEISVPVAAKVTFSVIAASKKIAILFQDQNMQPTGAGTITLEELIALTETAKAHPALQPPKSDPEEPEAPRFIPETLQ